MEEHLERLYDSAKSVMLEIPHTFEELTNIVTETLRRNELRDAYIRLVVSRGAGNLGLDPLSCPRPSVIVIAEALSLFPKALYETGKKIVGGSTPRTLSHVKPESEVAQLHE